MDMLNADLQLKNDASSRRKSKAKSSDDDDAGFHFIAFVPVQDSVWKLDGLERQPQNLGPITGDDWVLQVAPEIETRMAQYEDGQIEFAILSLVQEPLTKLVAALAENVKSIAAVRHHLAKLPNGLEELQQGSMGANIEEEQNLVLGPCEQYKLTQEVLDQAVLSPQFEQQVDNAEASELQTIEKELIVAQVSIRASTMEELKAIEAGNDRAASRRNDKGLLAKGLLEVLARMDRIQSIMESYGCS
ncbi:MAG: hypothetical protein Q9182_006607 [Xanthomendoza sp. 2 TL-2023]